MFYNRRQSTQMKRLIEAFNSMQFLCKEGIKGSEAQEEDWDYTFNGNDWGGTCRTGKRQSPIDIRTKWTTDKESPKPFQLINYDRDVPVHIEVEQYTIVVRPKDPNVRISGGGLKGTYVLQEVHFHWGSEHLINSQRFALEAHLVHFREIYGNRSDAATNDPEGIAVFGVLYCLGASNPTIEEVLKNINKEVSLSFQDFLPEDLDFYRYYGSLTTPPCAEAVVWTVFKHKPTLTKQQLAKIKGLFPSIHSTYRNVQLPNRPEITRWKFSKENKNKVGGLKGSTNLLMAAPLLARNVREIF